jgi:hypothetical protein
VCDARIMSAMVRIPTRYSSFRLVERGSVGVHSGAPQQLPPPDVLGNSPRECLGGEGAAQQWYDCCRWLHWWAGPECPPTVPWQPHEVRGATPT